MTKVNDNLYYYDFSDITKAKTGIIFNNGSKQTENLTSLLTNSQTTFIYQISDADSWHVSGTVISTNISFDFENEGCVLYTAQKVNGKEGVWASGNILPEEHMFTKGSDDNYHLTINNTGGDIYFRLVNTKTLNQYGAPSNDRELAIEQQESLVWSQSPNYSQDYSWVIRGLESTKHYELIAHFEDDPGKSSWIYVEDLDKPLYNYYFVSPEITDGKMLPQFKLVPDRNRNGGPISKKYYTLNYKSDELKEYATTLYHWYIKNADTGECYWPSSSDDIGFKNWDHTKNDNVWIGYAETQRGNTAPSESNMFARTNDENGRSYSIFFNSENGGVHFNVNNIGCTEEEKIYYLIGNFTSAKANVNINPAEAAGRKQMNKWYWQNGTRYDHAVAPYDSIVYTVEISRPPEGWGQLYLDVCPEMDWNLFSTDAVAAWKNVIRPQIQDWECGHSMDARALSGGLITNQKGNGDWMQSLNPEVSEVYTSYEFSMNATYSTYRIVFKTELALVGTAVTAKNGNTTYGGSFDLTNRINLTYNEEEGCYKWLHNDGIIHIKSYEGKDMPEFRFVVIGSSSTGYKWNLSEDENAPTSPYYNDAAHGDRPYIGGDTQFKNALAVHKDGPSDATQDPGDGKNLRSYLPEGDYVLRFYIKGDETKTYYYTLTRVLKMRDFKSKGTVEGLGNYTYFTTWSDYLAYDKPDGVDIYAVTGFSDGGATVKNITNEVDCLPAKTGLILAKKDTGESPNSNDDEMPGFNVLNLTLKVYDEPEQSYAGGSLMNCAYQAQDLPQYDNGTANYLFGAYRKDLATGNASDTGYLLGFWLSNGTNRTYHNSAYLSLSGQQQDDIFQGKEYSWGTTSPTRSWISLRFGEDGFTTSIAAPRRSDDSDLWYNLQGIGMTQPQGKGFYIHQGRKVIVR